MMEQIRNKSGGEIMEEHFRITKHIGWALLIIMCSMGLQTVALAYWEPLRFVAFAGLSGGGIWLMGLSFKRHLMY